MELEQAWNSSLFWPVWNAFSILAQMVIHTGQKEIDKKAGGGKKTSQEGPEEFRWGGGQRSVQISRQRLKRLMNWMIKKEVDSQCPFPITASIQTVQCPRLSIRKAILILSLVKLSVDKHWLIFTVYSHVWKLSDTSQGRFKGRKNQY